MAFGFMARRAAALGIDLPPAPRLPRCSTFYLDLATQLPPVAAIPFILAPAVLPGQQIMERRGPLVSPRMAG